MALESAKLNDNYDVPFVLDESKLTRIVSILQEHYESAKLRYAIQFELTYAEGRIVRVNTLDEVLRESNSTKTPVRALDLSSQSTDDWNALRCRLEFQRSAWTS